MWQAGNSSHRDDGIDWNDEEAHSNQCNFSELILFRAETDNVLQTQLKNAPNTAKYTPKNYLRTIDIHHR